jgi:hypothetical protein
MKKLVHCGIVVTLFISCNQETKSAGNKNLIPKDTALSEVEKWFSAWELVCRDIYKIADIKPVEFVFFDQANVYSTSQVSVANGERMAGPSLFNNELVWYKKAHNGEITLPDKKVVPVSLMSFAGAVPADSNKAFFVMPLLDFWKSAGVESKELGLEKLITGVFLHEFSHTQQMQNFGRKITKYEQENTFQVEFNDDIIQSCYESDSIYTLKFREEVRIFYEAALTTDKTKQDSLIKQGLKKMEYRQQRYFVSKLAVLKKIDGLFLTMEGLGQFTMYLWLIHPKGGNILSEVAIKGIRRGGKKWSQEEGFALFLVLNKLSKSMNWVAAMFGSGTPDIVQILKNKKY